MIERVDSKKRGAHHSIIIFGSELTFVAEFIYTETVKTLFLFYPNEIPREYCNL